MEKKQSWVSISLHFVKLNGLDSRTNIFQKVNKNDIRAI